MSSGVVIDASAALAYVLREPGGERVLDRMTGAAISAANWAEVVEKAITADVDIGRLRASFEVLGASVLPVDAGQAEYAAHLRGPTRSQGLSLADRICFALAVDLGMPVLTADQAWKDLDIGVEVRLIR
jgi:ribonuclease VapC